MSQDRRLLADLKKSYGAANGKALKQRYAETPGEHVDRKRSEYSEELGEGGTVDQGLNGSDQDVAYGLIRDPRDTDGGDPYSLKNPDGSISNMFPTHTPERQAEIKAKREAREREEQSRAAAWNVKQQKPKEESVMEQLRKLMGL